MKGRIPAYAAVLAALLLGCTPVRAQRTMRGQDQVTAWGWSACVSPLSAGGGVSWGRYLDHAFWRVSLTAGRTGADLGRRFGTVYPFRKDYLPVTVGGGYMHRLVSNRSRSLALYAGGDVLLGCECYTTFGGMPSHLESNLPKAVFVYGLSPSLEAEVFLYRGVAAVLSASMPLHFGSYMNVIGCRVCLGIRVDI